MPDTLNQDDQYSHPAPPVPPAQGPAPAAPPALPPTRQPFKLWKFNLILIILFMGLLASLFVTGRVTADSSPKPGYAYGYVAGTFLSTILIGLLFGWIAYRLGRRSNRVGNIVFTIVFLVFAADKYAGIIVRFPNQPPKSVREFTTNLRELNRQQLQSYEDGSTTGAMEHIERVKDLAGEMEKQGGTEAKLASALKDVLTISQERVKPLDEAGQDFINNPIDFSTMKTAPDFEPPLARLRTMRDETEKFLAFFETMPDIMRKIAEEKDLPAAAVNSFVEGGRKATRPEKHREYRQTVIAFCNAMEEYCVFLRDNLGQWEYNTDLEEPVFKPDAPAENRTHFADLTTSMTETASVMITTEEDFMREQLGR